MYSFHVKFEVYMGKSETSFLGQIMEIETTNKECYERDGEQEMAQLLQGHRYKSLGCSCCVSLEYEALRLEVHLLQTISWEVS
jgi:hypothetical protein